jgi:hypothetical protein
MKVELRVIEDLSLDSFFDSFTQLTEDLKIGLIGKSVAWLKCGNLSGFPIILREGSLIEAFSISRIGTYECKENDIYIFDLNMDKINKLWNSKETNDLLKG